MLKAELVPPAPEQDRLNVVVAKSGPTSSLPAVVFAPLQPPDAEQEVALVEDQDNVVEAPA
jgi:hypothetical protein